MAEPGGFARPSVLLLPGSFCDHRVFAAQLRALRTRAQVTVADMHRMRDPDSWVVHLLAQLPPRVSIVGFSLGGLIALELLRRAPERIERLAMVASNAEAGSRATERRCRALWRCWRQRGPVAAVRRAQPDLFARPTRRPASAELVVRMARSTPAAAARGQIRFVAARKGGSTPLAACAAPVLIVSGARDRVCPRRLQRRMVRAQPRAHWVELPHCGHYVSLDAPERLSRLLMDWLKRPAYPTLDGTTE